MRWKYRLHPARALMWLLARLYRTKDEQLGRMLIELGRMYLRRPDEIDPDAKMCVELVKLGTLNQYLVGIWHTEQDEHRRVFRRPRQ